MQLFDLAKLFKFEPELDPHKSVIVNHLDISTVGTKVHKPVTGFRSESNVITQPFMKFQDGTTLSFPDTPENHQAMATLSRFYHANNMINHLQYIAENKGLTIREQSELKKAVKTVMQFQKTYT